MAGTDPSGQSFWTDIRDIVITAIAAYADASGCGGACSAAVGAYRGSQNGGGVTGAIVGGIQGYVGYQVVDNFPLTDMVTGSVLWQNVAAATMVNAATGCAAASARGGNCGQAALTGAMGTVGSAFGNVGAVIAGCAAGKISGGSCRDGAVRAMETYAVNVGVNAATRYITESSQKPTRFGPALILAAPEAGVLAGEIVVGTGLGVGIAATWDKITNWILNVNGAADSANLPKPEGTPGNWVETPTRDGSGRQWVNPDNKHDRIRVMPGNPSSSNPAQQNPYGVQVWGGNRALDSNGNVVAPNSPDAHIPLDQLRFRPKPK